MPFQCSFYIPKCKCQLNRAKSNSDPFYVFKLKYKAHLLLFKSFSSNSHLYWGLLRTLSHLKVHDGTYSITILIEHRHFIDLKIHSHCQSSGSYSLVCYSCFSIDSDEGELSDMVKHRHHAFYPIYSYRVPSIKYVSN